jgi:hypothetical protein
MTAFSKETIHDVKDVIVTRRTVQAIGSTWDTFDVEIVDMEGNSKALLLFGSEGKTMRFQRREDDES